MGGLFAFFRALLDLNEVIHTLHTITGARGRDQDRQLVPTHAVNIDMHAAAVSQSINDPYLPVLIRV